MTISPDLIAQHQLTESEYRKIVGILGREPSYTELGIFSVMWSEHCSYKSSKVHLKRLPTRGKLVVQGPGENAGVVDIGDGLVAMRLCCPVDLRTATICARARLRDFHR